MDISFLGFFLQNRIILKEFLIIICGIVLETYPDDLTHVGYPSDRLCTIHKRIVPYLKVVVLTPVYLSIKFFQTPSEVKLISIPRIIQ